MIYDKGDIVCFNNHKAKVIGVATKGGKRMYKLREYDKFHTVCFNVSQSQISKYKDIPKEE